MSIWPSNCCGNIHMVCVEGLVLRQILFYVLCHFASCAFGAALAMSIRTMGSVCWFVLLCPVASLCALHQPCVVQWVIGMGPPIGRKGVPFLHCQHQGRSRLIESCAFWHTYSCAFFYTLGCACLLPLHMVVLMSVPSLQEKPLTV